MSFERHILALVRVALAVTLGWTVTIAAAAAHQTQPPTFRAGKTLRLVDVTVTDARGQFVADLVSTDFEIKVGRRSVPVDAFYRIVDSRVLAAPSARANADLSSMAYAPVRTFVLYFDTAHFGLAALDRAKTAAQGFLQRELHPADYVGIIAGDRFVKGRLLTSSEDLAGAIASVKPDPNGLAQVIAASPAPTPDADQAHSRAEEAEAEINAALARADASVGDGGVGWEGEKSLAHLFAIVNGMQSLPGRRVIVFLSNGMSLGGFMPKQTSGTGYETMKMIVEAAEKAGVRIYTIDPSGLDQGFASSLIISAEAPRPAGTSVNPDELSQNSRSVRMTPNDVLASLALDTGGLWLHNENDLAKVFDRVARDNGSYYVLGYDASAGEQGNFTLHVKRSGVTVRARRGIATR